MKKNYTIIFAENNLNKSENFIIDFEELEVEEEFIKKELEKIVFIPRQSVVNKILDFARESKS